MVGGRFAQQTTSFAADDRHQPEPLFLQGGGILAETVEEIA